MGLTSGKYDISDPEKLASTVVQKTTGNSLIIGTSGFGSVGYPKTMPRYLAEEAVSKGVKLSVLTGASAYDMDGIFAEKRVAVRRYPYQNNPIMRKLINDGLVEFMDYHLG
ncbi:MAG: hypothetical protein GSR79_05840, partial [Desulfurococcales archaeon]|nr:hypothetical protein [Desulfurococcales archaeon]